tara:strand:- start:388 stop:984 length:597 start_codon:yes stop_codon:yes gene_type:complete
VANKLKLTFLIFVTFYSKITFAASKSNEGMPQLDVTTYPSLIFWLVLTFGFTYIVLKYYVTPRMSEILNHRKEKIDNDLFEAKKARESAEENKSNQDKSISEAKQKAMEIVREAVEKTKEELLEAENLVKDKLSKKLAVAEKNILVTKNESLKNVDKLSSEIAVLISDKVSGIEINKNFISKSINEEMKSFNLLKNLK